MLYLAYGSNLNHVQMKERCRDSKYIKNYFLEGYLLSFCTFDHSHGVANIVKKSNSKVQGGIWNISVRDEKELDYYEGYPIKYSKAFFKLNDEKIMFYIMKGQYSFKPPKNQYANIINQGYKDCNLDRNYLIKKLKQYRIELN